LKIVIIGGGAAGFFAALTCAESFPKAQITILEKSPKLLSKVKVSGGGRCNVTHACYEHGDLVKYYPRGAKFLQEAFRQFMPQDMVNWLEKWDVRLKTEADGRIFPISDDSQTIIDCFLEVAKRYKIAIRIDTEVGEILPLAPQGFEIILKKHPKITADRVIIATGGSPKIAGFQWLQSLGHTVNAPVPSLFTFNMPQETIKELMGVAVPQVKVKIQGTSLLQQGDLLITHWGMSGPAILKTSAWGARDLAERNYHFQALVHWISAWGEEKLRQYFLSEKVNNPNRKPVNYPLDIPKRLWQFLLEKSGIAIVKTWQEISKADLNRLVNTLTQDSYEVQGKTTFKEEFVTCGGVLLSEVNPSTMQSRIVPHVFFAGEVLDIDGVTGGFNFQSAWTTGYIAGKNAGN
jgi:hypothetical protein